MIVLVNYPFTDQTCAKLRPALVVSNAEFNNREDFVAVAISSRVDQQDPHGYVIGNTEAYFASTRLRCSSTVKWTKLLTISSTVVQRKLGTLPAEVLVEIQGRIRTIFA